MTSAFAENLAKKGVSMENAKPVALQTIEAVISAMRDIARIDVKVVAEMKAQDENISKEIGDARADAFFQERKKRLDDFGERRKSMSLERLARLLVAKGVSESTARTLADEVFEQEEKIIPLPKK